MSRPSTLIFERVLLHLLIAVALAGVFVIGGQALLDHLLPLPITEPSKAALDPSGLSY